MSSQRGMVGNPLADLRRQKRIDVQAGKLQLQVGQHVAAQFNPSIHRQAGRGEIRSRRELQMIAMSHSVDRNAAETVPVKHQATYLHMGIDQRLFDGARENSSFRSDSMSPRSSIPPSTAKLAAGT